MTVTGQQPPSGLPRRAVYSTVIQDAVTGAVLPTALVTVVSNEDQTTPVSFPVYAGHAGRSASSPTANPFSVTSGQIIVYTDAEEEFTLLIDVAGHARAVVTDKVSKTLFDPIIENEPTTGDVLMAIDATHVHWAPAPSDSTVVNPDDPSTVPSVYYIKDVDSVVWGITVDTTGHLTTTTYAGPPQAPTSVTIDLANGELHVVCPDLDLANDGLTITYAEQGYLAAAPADGDYQPLPLFSQGATEQGQGEFLVPISGLVADSGDFGSHQLHVRVVHTRGSLSSAHTDGVLAGAQIQGGGFQQPTAS